MRGICFSKLGLITIVLIAILTLLVLRLHESLDEHVGGLGVQREGVAQRLQLGALLQKVALEAVARPVEVLLWMCETTLVVRWGGGSNINRLKGICLFLVIIVLSMFKVLISIV